MEKILTSNARVKVRGYWLRRGAAFLLDLGITETIADVLTGWVVAPVPSLVISLFRGLVLFAYWAGSEMAFQRTPGMALLRMRVVDATGGRPATTAALKRAAAIAALFGIDVFELLVPITAGLVPQAFKVLQGGIGLGYLLHVAVVARRGSAILLHDAWSGTRVAWRELPSAAKAFDPGVARTGVVTTALSLALAVLAGLASGGFDWKLLWTPARASESLERDLEQRITRKVGIRNSVTSLSKVHWATGEPTTRMAEITAAIPWGAYSEEIARRTFEAMSESIRVQPTYDRLEFVVEASVEGLIRLNKRARWSFAYDSTARTFRPVKRADP